MKIVIELNGQLKVIDGSTTIAEMQALASQGATIIEFYKVGR